MSLWRDEDYARGMRVVAIDSWGPREGTVSHELHADDDDQVCMLHEVNTDTQIRLGFPLFGECIMSN